MSSHILCETDRCRDAQDAAVQELLGAGPLLQELLQARAQQLLLVHHPSASRLTDFPRAAERKSINPAGGGGLEVGGASQRKTQSWNWGQGGVRLGRGEGGGEFGGQTTNQSGGGKGETSKTIKNPGETNSRLLKGMMVEKNGESGGLGGKWVSFWFPC